MKFLLYSVSGEGAQIAKQIELEGNTVGLYIKDKIYSTVFDGLLTKVKNPDEFIDKETIIIFDMSGNGSYADSLKRKGYLVYGASSFADDLELDREFGFSAMRECGIQIPEYNEFKDWNEGRKAVQESNKRLVFKPSGSMPTKLTYVSKDSEELITYMNFVEKHFKKDIDCFILQEFIEGEVISSEFFCDGKRFLMPGNHTVEDKKSMNAGLGASTGCSGNITWCADTKIMAKGIKLAEQLCINNSYIGQMDLNAVVNESGVYGLEWTPRFGYDATPTLLALLQGDFGKFFSDLTRGDMKELPILEDYAGSIRVTIPPYPAEPQSGVNPEKFSPSIGVPILNWEDVQKDLYFYEVSIEEDQLVHSGGVGVIGCAIGISGDPEESMDLAYEVAEELNIPDKQYRTDLKEVLSDMVQGVKEYA